MASSVRENWIGVDQKGLAGPTNWRIKSERPFSCAAFSHPPFFVNQSIMNNLEFNKVFAALLVAGVVAMLCGFIAKQVVHPETLAKNAVLIEAAQAAEGGSAVATGPEPILGLLAKADIAKGKAIAKACSACHNFDNPGKDGVGPHLWGVVGRAKDSVAGFAYSGELEKVGDKKWTYAELNKFLYKPKAYASGTKMTFIGVKKPEDRAALIAYLRTLNDAPLPLPTDAEISAETPAPAPAAPASTATPTPAH